MKNTLYASMLIALVVTATPSLSAPLSSKSHPRMFCELAADLGYPSRGFKEHTGGCSSNMTDVSPTSGKNGLNNNLAFYSMGKSDDAKKLQRVSLILNVNNVREKAKAHRELSRVAKSVATKILGEPLPQLSAVIEANGSRTWEVGEWSIEVKSDIWPTGLGHDMTVYFRPK